MVFPLSNTIAQLVMNHTEETGIQKQPFTSINNILN